jgi:hypothetical protein
VLAVESATPENSVAASRDWVAASEMSDVDPALVGTSFAMLKRKGQAEVSEARCGFLRIVLEMASSACHSFPFP